MFGHNHLSNFFARTVVKTMFQDKTYFNTMVDDFDYVEVLNTIKC